MCQQVQDEQLSAVVDWLTAQPRAAQLVDKDSSVVSTLEYHMGHYLKDVKRHYVRADKRYTRPSPQGVCPTFVVSKRRYCNSRISP